MLWKFEFSQTFTSITITIWKHREDVFFFYEIKSRSNVLCFHRVECNVCIDLCRVTGAHRRTGTTRFQQSFQVKKIIKNCHFSMRHLKNDIALLELERPVPLNDKVNLICLPQKDSRVAPGTKCYITGNIHSTLFYFILHDCNITHLHVASERCEM